MNKFILTMEDAGVGAYDSDFAAFLAPTSTDSDATFGRRQGTEEDQVLCIVI